MAKSKRNTDPFKQALYSPRTDKKQLISSLKTEGYTSFKRKIKKAYSHPFTKKYIQGSLLPKSYNELRKVKPSLFSNNLEGELSWLAASFSDQKILLNNFIELESGLQDSILRDEYKESIEILNSIKSEVCYSFWGLEVEYFLVDKAEGTEGNWKRKNEINEQLSNRFSIFLNQVFSKKAEKGFSSKDYHRSLYNEIRNTSKYDFEYLNFRLANHLMPKYELLTFFAYVDGNSSLIDRYLSLINLFGEILSSDYDNAKLLVKNIIQDYLSEVNDTRIDRLLEFVGEKDCSKSNESGFTKIIEDYSTADYQSCIDLIPSELLKSPSQVELWDIYVKSLIEVGDEYIATDVSEFVDGILKKLYQIYSLNGSIEDISDQILKLIVTIPNFKFSNQLLNLLYFSEEINASGTKRTLKYYINSNYFNPIITTIDSNEVKFSSHLYPKTLECLNYMHGKSNDKAKTLSPFKKQLYEIRNLFSSDKFDELVKYKGSIEVQSSLDNIYTEEITLMLFLSYLKLDLLDEAVDLYVNSYFKNKNLLRRIKADLLIEKIIESDYDVQTRLNLAILFVIEDLDFYYQFVGLEMWLELVEVELPSEIDLENTDEADKTIYLLVNGCKIEVLEKFYYQFDSREEVIEERKNILKNLIKVEADNYDPFIDELTSIVQKQKVQSVLSEVNSGRIRLSSDMLNSEENNFKNNYDRYKLISDFSSYNDLTLYDGKDLLNDFFQSLSESKSESLDPAFYTFRSLVNEMLDSFLFNKKNGLDGDLSTRIRHGELENQLRSIFDRNHLISKKDDNDTYEDVIFWSNLLNNRMVPESIYGIQHKLKLFSEKIDNIIQFLVRQQIQVISENYTQNKYGFFNFSYNESYWSLIHKESLQVADNYIDFKEYIYSIIKVTTEQMLQETRKYFVSNLQEDLNMELDNLNADLMSCIKQAEYPELFQNIIDAKRDLQNEISDLTEWFVVSDSTIDKSMDIKTLVQTSFESHNIKHPNAIIVPEIEADEKVFLYNYKHFIYIILNLLDNVRSHSKLGVENMNVKTKAQYFPNEQVLEFSVRNNYNSKLISKEDLLNKFLTIKENWNKDVNRESVNLEGGTGFEKIKKILVYDIKSQHHDFKFHIDDEYLEIGFRINITHNYSIDGN